MEHAELISRGGAGALVVFVHGLFGSFRETWGEFPNLLCSDASLSHCDVLCWGYPSPKGGFLPRLRFVGRKVPTVESVAQTLLTDLGNPALGGGSRELVLVGHSMGGLVLMHMLLEAERRGGDAHRLLERVRHVVLYATPVEGVEPNAILRLHPQSKRLAIDSDLIARTSREWQARFTDREGEPARRLLPVTAIVGLEDNAVAEASAKSVFTDVETVPGSHTGMCKPGGTSDSAYMVLRDRILRSVLGPFHQGHASVLRAHHAVLRSARDTFYAVGSRSRDEAYLKAIEARLRSSPELIYTRILMGPPRRHVLVEHLERVFGFRDPSDRSAGKRTLYVGLFTAFDVQAEFNLCGSENACTLILPPLDGVGNYSAALTMHDAVRVGGYKALVSDLFGRSRDIQTVDLLRALVAENPPP